jgi:uncharacterized coiled-coil DUF342 family protein
MPDEVSPQIHKLQEEIASLRKKLGELNDAKEALFAKRNDIGRQISSLIKEVKGVRGARDALTGTVKLSKEERAALNEQIKSKMAELNKLKAEREGKPPVEDPRFLKQQIERLNFKIETDVMSFDKEKQLMKVIKDLKKKFDEAEKTFAVIRKIRHLSRDVEGLRAIADQAHGKVQEAAKESQSKHEAMITTSHKIDELKAAEAVLNEQINQKKADMAPVMKELDDKQAALRKVRQEAGLAEESDKKQTAAAQKKKLSDMQADVMDKMKKGEKLTTEDLLILQSGS